MSTSGFLLCDVDLDFMDVSWRPRRRLSSTCIAFDESQLQNDSGTGQDAVFHLVRGSLGAGETSHDLLLLRTSAFHCHLLVKRNNSSDALQGASGGTGPGDRRPLGARLIISAEDPAAISSLHGARTGPSADPAARSARAAAAAAEQDPHDLDV
ncbi:hypothetical protein INR49_004773 [Caranx melampygus]|nr:hypothetical protein INR49_004773 [Caranx melampygus]